MKNQTFFRELKTYLFLGIKFGIVGALIGFILHAIWGNLEEVKYTVFNGFLIGFFVGFFELIFSNPKVEKLPYSVLLLFRTISYFLIIVIRKYEIVLKSNNTE